jgi:ATP-binding cassette, subfamily B (MDR/TAP), member 1
LPPTPRVRSTYGARPSPSWKSLFGFTTRKHIFALAPALMLTVITGIIMPTFAFLLGSLFNSFTDFGSGQILRSQFLIVASKGSLMLLGLGIASWILNAMYFTAWIIFGELQSGGLHRRFFSELLNKDLQWFETTDGGAGAFISRLQA